MPVRVAVDPDLCEANGVCVGLAPRVFRLDDAERLHVRGDAVAPEDVDAVRRAVARCPKGALRLKD